MSPLGLNSHSTRCGANQKRFLAIGTSAGPVVRPAMRCPSFTVTNVTLPLVGLTYRPACRPSCSADGLYDAVTGAGGGGSAPLRKARLTPSAGRAEDGAAMGQRAVQLDLGSGTTRIALAWRLRGANQLEPAAREANIALGLDPTAIDAYWILAEVFLRRGNYREAEKYARRYIDAGGDVPANSTTLGEILARSGQVAEANAYAARLSLLATRDGPSLVALARTEMALGREERALSLLERAVRARVFTIPFQPYWDPIRDTPRFRALMRAQGLE